MASISWQTGISGRFADPTLWAGGIVPGACDSARIVASGTYTVSSSADQAVRNLALGGAATLSITGGTFGIGVAGSGLPPLTVGAAASIAVASGATLQLGYGGQTSQQSGGRSSLAGHLAIANGARVQFVAHGSLEGEGLFGSGVITMAGPGSEIDIGVASLETDAAISGAGSIVITSKDGSAAFINRASIDADRAGASLTVATGTMTSLYNGVSLFTNFYNAGTAEATKGGQLLLTAGRAGTLMAISNNVIQAVGAGSRVDLDGAVVTGGTVTTADGGVVEVAAGGGTLWGISAGVTNAGVIRVDAGTTLSLLGSIHNSGSIALSATAGTAATLRLQSLADFEGGTDTAATRIVTLDGGGAVTLSDDAANLIAATRATDRLANVDNTISGAGRIGGGAAMSVANAGVIDATGSSALTIDIANGKFTNQAHGLLEGTGAAGLSFASGTFQNSGTVAAGNGSAVTFGSGATIGNMAGGTLTGGLWTATDTGGGAMLALSGSAVGTDAAKIILTGTNAAFEAGGTSLEQSLTRIAAGGTLALLGSRSWTGAHALADDGHLQIAGGTIDASDLSVGAGGAVSGFGTITAPLANAGTVEALGGALVLSGAVNGAGTLQVDGHATLEIGGGLSGSQTVAFHGTAATLLLDHPQAFAATIANWSFGDTIDLAATHATSAAIDGNTLQIGLSGGAELDYALSNPAGGSRIVLSDDHHGGTGIALFRAQAA